MYSITDHLCHNHKTCVCFIGNGNVMVKSPFQFLPVIKVHYILVSFFFNLYV